VLQVSFAGRRLLLPGDIGEGRERQLVRFWREALRSEWLLVGHHGSATSTSLVWLKNVQPRYAVISRGYGNSFGHPHPSVIARLRQRDVTLLDTAESGALQFDISTGGITVRAWREAERRFWM
jgi:competence protein ComEC